MKVRMPVIVARSSIRGSSIRGVLDSSLIGNPLLFVRHDLGLNTVLHICQHLPNQDGLDFCPRAALS